MFEERLKSLQYAHKLGFKTSVSSEPLLDINLNKIYDMVTTLKPFVSDSIWLGKMNLGKKRVSINGGSNEDIKRLKQLVEFQNDENIKILYNKFKNDNKIKWKESIKKIVGIELSQEKGLDI